MAWFMDLALSRRLERTEGAVGASFTAVQQARAPELGATWYDFDGTYAIFDGDSSPMTQTFGLGLFAPVSASSLSAIEAFFTSRDAPVMHEVSPLAGIEAVQLLADRNYRPIELSTVLAQAIDELPAPPAAPGLHARQIAPADRAAWVETSVAGWSAEPAFAAIIRSMAEAASENPAMQHYVVERDGAPVATGSLAIHDGVALLAGASTIPAARGLGAQAVLLGARLAEARRQGCELAMMAAAAGSTSQRNAERRGFRVAYTRTKWQLRAGRA
jgi:GNAT superfamily N-acetyltransferase